MSCPRFATAVAVSLARVFFAVPLSVLGCVATFGLVASPGFVASPKAWGQSVGFLEKFALAEDRQRVLQELIPGSEEYFYFHCLHLQTQGKVIESEAVLKEWLQTHPGSQGAQQMLMRQRLLGYSGNAQQTLDHLRLTFGLQLDHAPPQADRAKDLPTSLDPAKLDRMPLIDQSLASAADLSGFSDAGLLWLDGRELTIDQVRIVLQRTGRIDLPGLVPMILKELKSQSSRGWNAFPIHSQLSLAQRQELVKAMPTLLENDAFVRQHLVRLQPSEDEPFDRIDVPRAHLQRLEDFVTTLPPSQNSLKAAVLHQRLKLDAAEGIYDRARLERYLALPRDQFYYSRDFLRSRGQSPLVELQADFSAETRCPPIGGDEAVIRDHLEHFFQGAESFDSFATWLDRDYLQRVFTETKILYGVGNAASWYAKLTPGEQQALRDRVELRFAGSSPHHYDATDAVTLTADLKNIPKLIVRIYQLNPRNIFRKSGSAVSTDLDLDGLVANAERTIEYSLPADRRHRETIAIPECDGRGSWMIDLLGGGLRSRALIVKGQLRSTELLTDAGHELRIYDESGKPAAGAHIEMGTRTFRPGDDGAILIPYAADQSTHPILLVDGSVATIETFLHRREGYSLWLGAMIDSQNLLAGSKGSLILRPILFCNDQVMPIANLDEAQLTIVTTDQDGTQSTQVAAAADLTADAEMTHQFLVPQRLRSIDVTLSGKVLAVSRDVREPVSASRQIVVNPSPDSTQIADFYLLHNEDGYRLQVRGRNGEGVARLPVSLNLNLLELTRPVTQLLATDATGTILLGRLEHIETIQASADGIAQRAFVLRRDVADWPAQLLLRDGESIALPWVEPAGTVPDRLTDYSLIELRGGAPLAVLNQRVKIADGQLRTEPLGHGRYLLVNRRTGQAVDIRVARGEPQGGFVIGPAQSLELSRAKFASIAKVESRDGKLRVQVGGSQGNPRVHLLATAFVEDPALVWRLRAPQPPVSWQPFAAARNFYVDSLKLDEEYQYILQRQYATRYPGNLLAQPSLLLNPWDTASTVNSSDQAEAGQVPPPMAADAMGRDPGSMAPSAKQVAEGGAGLLGYDFLADNAILMANRKPDAQGWVELPLEGLKGYQTVTAVVVDGTSMTSRTIPLSMTEIPLADLRLAEAFPAEKHLAQRQRVKVIEPNAATDLGDARSTRVQLYTSIADLFRLYGTLLPSEELEKFRVLTRWHRLDAKEKQRTYSELACHELHLFLYFKDRPFFDSAVRPYLANKLQPQLVDDFLVGSDPARYQDLWQLGRLNTLERILLAQRDPTMRPGLRKWLRDYVEAEPIAPEERLSVFLTALAGASLDVDQAGLLAESLSLGDNAADEKDFDRLRYSRFGIEAAKRDNQRLAEQEKFGLGLERKSQQADFFALPEGEAAGNRPGLQVPAAGAVPGAPTDGVALGGGMGGMGGMMGGMGGGAFGSDKSRGLSRRAAGRYEERFFMRLDTTREWAESQYHRTRLADQQLATIPPGPFWKGLADRDTLDGFLSVDAHLAAGTLSEALVAIALTDLPLETPQVQLAVEEGRWKVTSPSRCLAFVESIEETAGGGEAKVLVGQDIYPLMPRPDGSPHEPLTGKPLVRGVGYSATVVATNPSAIPKVISVLTQIPAGAIPLRSGKVVASQWLKLDPYSTQQVSYAFYFPQSGEFSHYGAQVNDNDQHVAAAASQSLRVLDRPEGEATDNWDYVSQWGTSEEVLGFLRTKNLRQVSLPMIAFRMRDKAFFEQALAELRSQGLFDATLWGYAILHDDKERLKEWAAHREDLAAMAGEILESPIAKIDSQERYDYEQLDYRPLVSARLHQLGPQRLILNDRLLGQYRRLLDRIAHKRGSDDRDRAALTYYLLLQNRIEEAIATFESIDGDAFAHRIQYDYLDAYLDFFRGRYDRAEEIAGRYVDHPVSRWRDLFAQVRLQVRQRAAMLEGKAPPTSLPTDTDATDPVQRMLLDARQSRQASLASSAPALDLTVRDGKPECSYRNLDRFEVRYYLMDIELLFSRNPFVKQDGSALVAIRPNAVATIEAEANSGKREIEIPAEFANRNVLVEVTAGGLAATQVVYANSMDCTVVDSFGRLQVTTDGGRPVEKSYVKVYARHQGGEVRFFKDGYTDLRGQFDYATLSTNDLETAERFAILVIHPELGALVREAAPPAR